MLKILTSFFLKKRKKNKNKNKKNKNKKKINKNKMYIYQFYFLFIYIKKGINYYFKKKIFFFWIKINMLI